MMVVIQNYDYLKHPHDPLRIFKYPKIDPSLHQLCYIAPGFYHRIATSTVDRLHGTISDPWRLHERWD